MVFQWSWSFCLDLSSLCVRASVDGGLSRVGVKLQISSCCDTSLWSHNQVAVDMFLTFMAKMIHYKVDRNYSVVTVALLSSFYLMPQNVIPHLKDVNEECMYKHTLKV